MKKVLNYIWIMGIAVIAISCAEPEQPTAGNQVIGSWTVDQFFVDSESGGSSVTILERFVLERDGSFLLVDGNGIAIVGTWEATETTLTLTDEDGNVAYLFDIVFQSFQKMQLLQTIESPTAGSFSIRYLMNNGSLNQY